MEQNDNQKDSPVTESGNGSETPAQQKKRRTFKKVIDQMGEEFQTLQGQLETLKNEFEQYKLEVYSDSQEKPGLIQRMRSTKDELVTELAQAKDLTKELATAHSSFLEAPPDKDLSQRDEIAKLYKECLEYEEKLDDLKETFESFEREMLGDEEKQVSGLKQRVEKQEADMKAKLREWQGNFDTLFKKIEGLLPGATSTGLSVAYQTRRKSYQLPYIIWSAVFAAAMSGMAWYAIATVIDAKTIGEAMMSLLSRTPLFVPLIWLGVFASRQQSQSRRLQEEYAYKESIAKSYESYKREIDALPASDEKTALLQNLMKSMVEMAGNNPSQTLQSKAHNDDPPFNLPFFKRKRKADETGSTE